MADYFHSERLFVSPPTLSTAVPTTLHCFINSHAAAGPNQFVAGHVGRRLAEKDLSNLIKLLWDGTEESSEEILC